MNRIWSFIGVKICAQYIISIYYWDTTTGQLKEGRSLMREKKLILNACHVRFTGLYMSRTCILQNTARHPRAFYWARTHGLHVRFTGLSMPCTWISYLPSSVCRSRSYHVIKFIMLNFRFSFRTYSTLTIITFHDFEQFTSSTTSNNCVMIAIAESYVLRDLSLIHIWRCRRS